MSDFEVRIYYNCEGCSLNKKTSCANSGLGCCNHLLYVPVKEKERKK